MPTWLVPVLIASPSLMMGCKAEKAVMLSQSVAHVAFGFSHEAICSPEELLLSFAGAKGFGLQSAGAMMQNGRREVKISLTSGSGVVGYALSNLVLPKSDGTWSPYLVRVDFDAPPNPSSGDVALARKRLDDFLKWMSTHNPQCWHIVEKSN